VARLPVNAALTLFFDDRGNSEDYWLPKALQRDTKGFVLTDRDLPDWEGPRVSFLLETSMPGIFCAGDALNGWPYFGGLDSCDGD
jgi:thioredoxin reductase